MSGNLEAKKKGSAGSSLTVSNLLEIGERFPADPDEEAKARERVNRLITKRLPAANSELGSIFASWSHKVYIDTEVLGGTWATAVDQSMSAPVCYINVPWTNSVDTDDGLMMVPPHEVLHWILGHFKNPLEIAGMSDSSKKNLRIAEDAMINWILMRMGFQFPTINGETIGIHPKTLFDWMKTQSKKHGVPMPSSIGDAFKTERALFQLLESIPAERRGDGSGKGGNWCHHGDHDLLVPGDGSGSGPGDGEPLPMDADAVGQMVTQMVEMAVQKATAGKSAEAKNELSILMDATEGDESASTFWGNTGAFEIRGRVAKRSQSSDWFKDTVSWCGKRLSQLRARDQYNRKVPFDPRISPKGRTRKKFGVVGVDVSGSMPQSWVDAYVEKMGKAFPELEIEFYAWDAKCARLGAGDDVTGGGGTIWECFDDMVYEAHKSNPPDFILTVTDGFFSKPAPKFDPSVYGWILIPGGDAFMAQPYTAANGRTVPRMKIVRVHEYN
jgi:hypothetical protein